MSAVYALAVVLCGAAGQAIAITVGFRLMRRR